MRMKYGRDLNFYIILAVADILRGIKYGEYIFTIVHYCLLDYYKTIAGRNHQGVRIILPATAFLRFAERLTELVSIRNTVISGILHLVIRKFEAPSRADFNLSYMSYILFLHLLHLTVYGIINIKTPTILKRTAKNLRCKFLGANIIVLLLKSIY